MALNRIVHPEFSLLGSEETHEIHQASLRILSEIGIRVDSEPARSVFRKAVGGGSFEGNTVRLPNEVVEWAIHASPPTIPVFDRLGNPAFVLGEPPTRFGIGATNLFYQDPTTDDVTPFTRNHMETCVRLGNSLSGFDAISTVGVLQDLSARVADLYATLEMVANTKKPLVLLISEEDLFPAALDLLECLVGDLSSKPFVIPYFNPVTPLIINQGTAEKMLSAIRRGLPFIYVSYAMAGVSTPITAAGTLALLNAELLAGLTLAQLAREGTPVALGSLPYFFDMKQLIDIYDVHTVLLNLACADMMAHYPLPHCGLSGSGLGWSADVLAAEELWVVHLTSFLGKVGIAPFVGSNLGSKVFSPSSAVYANEVIAKCRRFSEGFPLSDDLVGLADIRKVGPGGTFLAVPATRMRFREAYLASEIFPDLSLEKWQALGRPAALEYLRRHTQSLLDRLGAPDDHDDLIAQGESLISRLRAG